MGTLPIWLRFTPTPNGAVLAGDPPVEDDTTQAYSIPIVIEAASTGGPAAVQDFNVEVPPSCQLDDSDSSRFTSPMDATFTLDRPEWFAVSACASRLNVAAPSVGESGALPSWLAFAPGKSSGTLGLGTAVISGTPPANAARTYSFELTIDDGPSSAEPVSEQFTLTVVPPAGPKFTSADTANFFVDQLSRFTVVSAGSPTPSLTIGDHPPWLDLEVFGGQATISGLPPSGSSDDYLITISAQNGVGSPVTQMLSIHVSGGPSGTTGTATTSGPSGTTGTVTTSGPSGTTGG